MNQISSLLYRSRLRAVTESGQTMVEYAFVLTLISVATVAAFSGLQGAISNAINSVAGSF